MSLINEALKRAKQAQQNAPPPPVLQLRAVDPAPAPNSGKVWGVLLPSGIALVAIAALVFVWHSFRSGNSPQVVEARTQPAAVQELLRHEPALAPKVAPAPTDATEASTPAQTPSVPQPPTSTESNPTAALTNTAAANLPAPEPQPALRLQAIFFNPRHASVLISGRTVFLGDKIGDLRLMRIGQTSVTLIGGGHTNLLELP